MFDEKDYFDPRKSQLNVNGTTLEPCSISPITGFLRDGCCSWDPRDGGSHTVCAIMTDEFLNFSKEKGNDLSTPRPEFQFEGLKDGDKWCLCAARWEEARQAGKAPIVVLQATNIKCLEICKIEDLKKHAGGT